MNVNDVYEIMKFAVNKNQNGYLKPADFNRTINLAQRSYVAYLLGNFETYTPGRPISKVEFGQNSVIRQRLSPSIYSYNLNIDTNGFSNYPGDYIQSDAMWSIYGLKRIRYASQERLYSIYNSKIDPVSSNPIYLIEDAGFQFYPSTLGNAKLSYIKNPDDIVWGYDDIAGRPVYNAAKSANPIWDNVAILEIIVRALMLVGVNLQLSVVSQYAEEIKSKGQ